MFDELEDAPADHELSAAVGWAIQLKSKLLDKEEVRRVRALLAGTFQGRSAHNWSLLVLCAEQVFFPQLCIHLYCNLFCVAS